MRNETILIKEKGVKAFALSRFMKILFIFILITMLILEVFSVYIVLKFSHPNSSNLSPDIRKYGIENYEKVSFNSLKDNLDLNGYLIRSGNSRNTIILCHGYTDSKFIVGGKTSSSPSVDNLKLAKLFSDLGFNTLLFDFRGHGERSAKAGVTIGFNEQKDLLGAINFVKSKGIGDKIGLIGFSMGAATTLSVLDKTNDISFAIADSPFSDLKNYLNNNMAVWTHLPNFPFVPMIILNFKLIYGVDYSTVSPLNSVSKSNIPILLVHGKNDTTIPYTESVTMEKLLKNNKSKLVLFEDSNHIGSYFLYKDKYETTLREFLTSID